jgi:RNA 2',3'-cyclic 3'-phosphodiesterase
MDHSFRLFVAIDLPPDAKALLAELQAQLQQHTRAVRWANPAGTHLTLKFLGEVDRAVVDHVVAGMRSATRRSPFSLHTTELGVFPNARRPRVVWLGVGGDREPLARLQAAVENTIGPLGFPAEDRPFSPHLTLGRTKRDPSPADLLSISHAVEQTKVPRSVVWIVRELVLMRSERLSTGARYTPVASVALDGG